MDLYALPPEQFTAARDAAAKQDRALKELRRPTVSAWVLNTLVRRDRAPLDDLLALGAELSRAQAAGQGDRLRELSEQRRRQVPAVVDRAAALVDRPLSATIRAEVERTLEAALADPASAEAVTSGRLVRALEFAGFGGVDLEGAAAGLTEPSRAARSAQRDSAPAGRHPEPAAGARAEATVSRAEAAAREAAGALDDAVRRAEVTARELNDHEKALAAAQAEEDSASAKIRETKEALKAAEQEQAAARRRRTGLEKAQEALVRRAKAATKGVGAAQDAADGARKALDRLRRGT